MRRSSASCSHRRATVRSGRRPARTVLHAGRDEVSTLSSRAALPACEARKFAGHGGECRAECVFSQRARRASTPQPIICGKIAAQGREKPRRANAEALKDPFRLTHHSHEAENVPARPSVTHARDTVRSSTRRVAHHHISAALCPWLCGGGRYRGPARGGVPEAEPAPRPAPGRAAAAAASATRAAGLVICAKTGRAQVSGGSWGVAARG